MATPVKFRSVIDSLNVLEEFVCPKQIQDFKMACLGLEYPFFRAKIYEWASRIKSMPKQIQDCLWGDQAIVYLHYFAKDVHWYVIVKDGTNDGLGQLQSIGWTDYGSKQNTGVDFINIREIVALGAQFDLYWVPKSLKEVKAS